MIFADCAQTCQAWQHRSVTTFPPGQWLKRRTARSVWPRCVFLWGCGSIALGFSTSMCGQDTVSSISALNLVMFWPRCHSSWSPETTDLENYVFIYVFFPAPNVFMHIHAHSLYGHPKRALTGPFVSLNMYAPIRTLLHTYNSHDDDDDDDDDDDNHHHDRHHHRHRHRHHDRHHHHHHHHHHIITSWPSSH